MAQSPTRYNTPNKSEEPHSEFPDGVSSPLFDINHEFTFHGLSPKNSPTAQVMIRPEDTESNKRIPSSVFASKCSSQAEWSTASSESLFSINSNHNSYGQDQDDMLELDVIKSGELTNSGDMTRFMVSSSPVGGESDMNGPKVRTPTKSDAPQYELDEPQRVVRWKSEVERHVEEKAPPQGDQLESSPLTNPQPNDFSNQASTHPRKKSWCCCCSLCNCCSCLWSSLSCWNACWASMTCSNCKPKRFCCCAFLSMEVTSPRKRAAPGKLDTEPQKPGAHKLCGLGPCFTCSWAWACRCC